MRLLRREREVGSKLIAEMAESSSTARGALAEEVEMKKLTVERDRQGPLARLVEQRQAALGGVEGQPVPGIRLPQLPRAMSCPGPFSPAAGWRDLK